MQATRLPGKPLAPIHGRPMIVHVWQRAMEAEIGRVVVATDSDEISEAVRAAGGEAVMTRPDHQSGSDRVYEAVSRIDPDGDCETVVNLQGDLPTLEIPRTELDAGAPALGLFVKAGLVASNGEARRQIKGGGLRINDVPVTDEKISLSLKDLTSDGVVKLSMGRKKHVLLKPV